MQSAPLAPFTYRRDLHFIYWCRTRGYSRNFGPHNAEERELIEQFRDINRGLGNPRVDFDDFYKLCQRCSQSDRNIKAS